MIYTPNDGVKVLIGVASIRVRLESGSTADSLGRFDGLSILILADRFRSNCELTSDAIKRSIAQCPLPKRITLTPHLKSLNP
jgi:hypothetical protein